MLNKFIRIIFSRALFFCTAALALVPGKVLAMNCPANTNRDAFGSGSGVTIIACADTSKYMGAAQNVVWGIQNQTGRRIEVRYDKLFFFSCGRQTTQPAVLHLEPGQSKLGAVFTGDDAYLSDSLFPDDDCGQPGSMLNRVGINNLRVKDLGLEEQQRKQTEAERQAQQRSLETARKEQETEAAARSRRPDSRPESGGYGGSGSSSAGTLVDHEEAERHRPVEPTPVQRTNQYIDNLTNQMQRESDASYRNYMQNNREEQRRLQESMEETIERLERKRDQMEEKISNLEGRVDDARDAAYDDARRSQQIKGVYDATINNYLEKYK